MNSNKINWKVVIILNSIVIFLKCLLCIPVQVTGGIKGFNYTCHISLIKYIRHVLFLANNKVYDAIYYSPLYFKLVIEIIACAVCVTMVTSIFYLVKNNNSKTKIR